MVITGRVRSRSYDMMRSDAYVTHFCYDTMRCIRKFITLLMFSELDIKVWIAHEFEIVCEKNPKTMDRRGHRNYVKSIWCPRKAIIFWYNPFRKDGYRGTWQVLYAFLTLPTNQNNTFCDFSTAMTQFRGANLQN